MFNIPLDNDLWVTIEDWEFREFEENDEPPLLFVDGDFDDIQVYDRDEILSYGKILLTIHKPGYSVTFLHSSKNYIFHEAECPECGEEEPRINIDIENSNVECLKCQKELMGQVERITVV